MMAAKQFLKTIFFARSQSLEPWRSQYVESSHLVIKMQIHHVDYFSLSLFADRDYHQLTLSDLALEREGGEEYQQDGGV